MLRKINHGEVIFKETILPKNANSIKNDKDFFVVGESGTIGNDHRITCKADTFLFEKDGVLYIKNDSPVDIYCPDESRHDTEVLPTSTWEIDIAQEFDYLTMEQRNVAD